MENQHATLREDHNSRDEDGSQTEMEWRQQHQADLDVDGSLWCTQEEQELCIMGLCEDFVFKKKLP